MPDHNPVPPELQCVSCWSNQVSRFPQKCTSSPQVPAILSHLLASIREDQLSSIAQSLHDRFTSTISADGVSENAALISKFVDTLVELPAEWNFDQIISDSFAEYLNLQTGTSEELLSIESPRVCFERVAFALQALNALFQRPAMLSAADRAAAERQFANSKAVGEQYDDYDEDDDDSGGSSSVLTSGLGYGGSLRDSHVMQRAMLVKRADTAKRNQINTLLIRTITASINSLFVTLSAPNGATPTPTDDIDLVCSAKVESKSTSRDDVTFYQWRLCSLLWSSKSFIPMIDQWLGADMHEMCDSSVHSSHQNADTNTAGAAAAASSSQTQPQGCGVDFYKSVFQMLESIADNFALIYMFKPDGNTINRIAKLAKAADLVLKDDISVDGKVAKRHAAAKRIAERRRERELAEQKRLQAAEERRQRAESKALKAKEAALAKVAKQANPVAAKAPKEPKTHQAEAADEQDFVDAFNLSDSLALLGEDNNLPSSFSESSFASSSPSSSDTQPAKQGLVSNVVSKLSSFFKSFTSTKSSPDTSSSSTAAASTQTPVVSSASAVVESDGQDWTTDTMFGALTEELSMATQLSAQPAAYVYNEQAGAVQAGKHEAIQSEEQIISSYIEDALQTMPEDEGVDAESIAIANQIKSLNQTLQTRMKHIRDLRVSTKMVLCAPCSKQASEFEQQTVVEKPSLDEASSNANASSASDSTAPANVSDDPKTRVATLEYAESTLRAKINELLASEQFGSCDLLSDNAPTKHQLLSYITQDENVQPVRGRLGRIRKELASLSNAMPWGIYLRVDNDRVDVMRAMIVGPQDTPYDLGLFVFDIYLPPNYPEEPPKVLFVTNGKGSFRFNPNLYSGQGKVCLSLLGTWSGPGWNPSQSTLLQVLISIQAMILNETPFLNEPGWESYFNHPNERWRIDVYDAAIRHGTMLYAMLWHLQEPPLGFEKVVAGHFFLNRHRLLHSMLTDDSVWVNPVIETNEKSSPSYLNSNGDYYYSDSNPSQMKRSRCVDALRESLSQVQPPSLDADDQ